MATNRYGQIWHGDSHHINIRFPSTEARLKFQKEFEAYHASHDHEGDIPIFKNVASKDLKLSTGSRSPQDLVKAETDEDYRITIDGYSWNEIHEYHNPTGWNNYFWYHVPTCCVPPIIVIDREFVDSGTLERHELSAIFGDMPDTDFQSLLDSVQTDGFIDSIVRIHEGQILDGWHRYRAAQELNLIRKLRFQQWNEDEKKDGDPKAFVLARNIERRHLLASQRAQIAVAFNERFGHGGDRNSENVSKRPEGLLKTQKDLAKEAGVGERTIRRAVQVEKTGQSEAVISGEKTAGEVLEEQKQARLTEARINANKALDKMWENFHASELTNCVEPDDFVKAACEHHRNWGVDDIPELEDTDIPEIWEARFNLLTTQIQTRSSWIQEFIGEETDTDTDEPLKERAFDNFCNTIENLDQAWKDANLPISFEDDFLPAAADRTNFFPDTIKELYEAGKARQQHEEYEDYISWNKTFTIILRGLQERSHWVEALAVEAESEASELLRAQERAITRRQRMWSYFASEIRVKQGKTIQEVSEEAFAKAAAAALGLDTIRVEKVGLQGIKYCFGADELILGDIESPPYSLSDCSLADAAMWESRFELIVLALVNMENWVRVLLEVESEVSDRGPSHTEKTDYEQIQQEHTQRLQELPTEIRAYIPKWIGANPVRAERFQSCKRQVTLKLLLNARSLIEHGSERGPDPFFKEEMEELLGRMKSNDKALIEKVCELLGEAESTEQPPASDAPDMNALWDAFNKRYPKWKAKYAESGYKENDLIQASTEAEMLDALRVYRETESERKGKQPTGSLPYSPSDRKGMPTADEVKDMTDLMSQQSYPFARCLRDLLRANSEKTESDAKTVADVLPGSEVLSIKVVCSGMQHFWFEDNSLTPDAIPLSCVPEEILVNLLMLTKDVKRLDVAAGEFVRAFGELGLGDSTMLYALERACTHCSCNLEELLMLTNLFPDRFDAEDAKTYRERMAAPHINAWINTLGSMKRDIESGENWMSGIKSGDYLS